MKNDEKLKNKKNILIIQNEENELKKEEKNKEKYYPLADSNFDNKQSQQNLGDLLGLYYSSEEETDIINKEKNSNENCDKKKGTNEFTYKEITEKISKNKNEVKLLEKMNDENEKISEIVNISEKKNYSKGEKKIINKNKNLIECDNQEKSAIESDEINKNTTKNENIMKNNSISNKGNEEYKEECNQHNYNEDPSILNKENTVTQSQKNTVNNGYSELSNCSINNMHVNYPYNICQNSIYDHYNFNYNLPNYNTNNNPSLYTNNINATNKSENFLNNFCFSKSKELNVDLTKIPVINQNKILNEWKPYIVQEEKKSKKYNIKTKVYNPVNNTFDKVIIHGKNQKRKHQINWLAKEAIEKEYEILQKTNYNKRRTTNDKYGW